MLRYSISPKTDIDLNALTVALLNYIVSQQKQNGFFIRVEDSDKDNTDESKIQDTISVLKKFAINTEAVVNQSSNLNIYAQLATNLIKEKKAFACFCDEEVQECSQNCQELEQVEIEAKVNSGQKYCVRTVEANEIVSFKDTILEKVEASPKQIGNVLILRANGLPSNNFATAVDDMSASIDTIIDLEKNIDTTVKEIYIHKLLNYDNSIEYAHLPNIKNLDNISLKWLLQEGFLPDAIINYLLTLVSGEERGLFYLPDAVEWLKLSNISKEPVEFNLEELKELNRKHLENFDSVKLSKIFGFADSDIGELLKLYLKDASTIKELDEHIVATFAPKPCTEEMQKLVDIIKSAPYIESFDEFVEYLENNSSLDKDSIIDALRVLLTGSDKSPDLELIYRYINPYILEVAKCR